ncbi:MAG: hypothetical protein ABFD54_07410 [Armatimonadota bacterium]|nr:hypothetical protein [bacterium]
MSFSKCRLCHYAVAIILFALLVAGPLSAAPRGLSLLTPNGGEVYQPGETVQVCWSCSGGWQTGDTVRLEYSSNTGTTWNQISGAQSLSYTVGSFAWNTTGLTASTQYLVKATSVGHENTSDTSDSVFTFFIDTKPPTVTHTRLYDIPAGAGPYRVCATATDDHGIASVKLYWSKNGGPITEASMSPSGNPNDYSADIPGPALSCDEFRYYIETTDTSYNPNITRLPAGAPTETYRVGVATQCTQVVGATTATTVAGPLMCGNIFYCSASSELLEFSQYLNLPTNLSGPTELRFVVYESPRPYGDGTFTKLLEKSVSTLESGTMMYSSGPINVHMVQGRSYLIAVAWQLSGVTAYYGYDSSVDSADFGVIKYSFDSTVYPPPSITQHSGFYFSRFNQSLTFCLDSRGLAIQFPTDNMYYWIEPGTVVPVTWKPTGSCWQPADTVRLEYSTNSGTTWAPIVGAENLPCEAGSFNWDTTGYPTSLDYLVRVVWNADSTVEDRCDTDFTLNWDTTGPSFSSLDKPLQDTGKLWWPFDVLVSLWDSVGTDTVTLYWSLNGGPFTAVPMTTSDPSGSWQSYKASIPGPLRIGDQVCYYVEASDVAKARNVSHEPANAPIDLHCFNITQCGADTVGAGYIASLMSSYTATNVFECTADSDLTQIEQYLEIVSGSELRFVVYESISGAPYTKIHENTITNPPVATRVWHSSGPISVRLLSGRSYMIGVAWPAAAYAYYDYDTPPSTSFGYWNCSYYGSCPPQATTSGSFYTSTDVLYQRLTSCRILRTVTCSAPNGGGIYEPGNSIGISWATLGVAWESSDTVKLEYSTDSGSTWNLISGAGSLPYNLGSYAWDTTGYPGSDHYRVRVVFNGDSSINDNCDVDFSLRTDSTPPVIVHTPLVDTAVLYGSYKVSAVVTDNYKMGNVTLYWRRNGDDFTAVTMPPTGNPNEYSADIPSAGKIGDTYCYYIQVVDGSLAGNIITEPAGAPGQPHCFTTVACAVDVLGTGLASATYTENLCGNVFNCSVTSELKEIRQHLNISSASSLVFYIYEYVPSSGTYTVKASYTVQNPGTGDAWYSSGPISFNLLSGYKYRICVYIQGTATAYYDLTGHPISTAIGNSSYGYGLVSGSAVFHQELTSCRTPCGITLTSFNSGGYYEPGSESCPKAVLMAWSYYGVNWRKSDTVRLEYSNDSGGTWNQIPGAEALAYPTASYNWNTSGFPELDHYRVRVVFNADSLVSDVSDNDFILKWDTTPPVVTHTPLQDTDNWNASTYQVSAGVTDDRWINSVTLYYSRNGSAYSSVAMGGSTTFSGNIPGGYKIGDTYSYYIVAKDGSCAMNTTRMPAEGAYQFKSIATLDRFTQQNGLHDLNNTCVTFTPNGAPDFYTACTRPILTLPTDPVDGTTLSLTNNGYQQVTLADNAQVSIYGNLFGSFYIGSDGYVSFGSTGTTYRYLADHFACKRISGLMCDLNPAAGGSVSWKQLADRVAVTYLNVPYYGTTTQNTFQIEMFFDGKIALSYLGIQYSSAITGLSAGTGTPTNFITSDFSAYPQCCPGDIVLEDSIAPADDKAMDFGRIDSGLSRRERVTLRNTSQCELLVKDIRITEYTEDFNDGFAQNWRELNDADWNVVNGQYVASTTSSSVDMISIYEGDVFNDFYWEVSARILHPGYMPILIFRVTPDFQIYPVVGSGYLFLVSMSCGVPDFGIYRQINGKIIMMASGRWSYGVTGGTYKLAVNAVGPLLQFFINGIKVAEVTDSSLSSGMLGLSVLNDYTSTFDDIVVTQPLGTTLPQARGFSLERLPTLPLMLAAGGSIDFDAIFAPTWGGPRSTNIFIDTSDPDQPTAKLRLSGTGISTQKCSSLKSLRDGGPVGITGGRVSAVFADRFYIQDDDRTGGIGVLWGGSMPAEGNLVTVVGSMTTQSGERLISATEVTAAGQQSAP